jgi:hypothetical protein
VGACRHELHTRVERVACVAAASHSLWRRRRRRCQCHRWTSRPRLHAQHVVAVLDDPDGTQTSSLRGQPRRHYGVCHRGPLPWSLWRELVRASVAVVSVPQYLCSQHSLLVVSCVHERVSVTCRGHVPRSCCARTVTPWRAPLRVVSLPSQDFDADASVWCGSLSKACSLAGVPMPAADDVLDGSVGASMSLDASHSLRGGHAAYVRVAPQPENVRAALQHFLMRTPAGVRTGSGTSVVTAASGVVLHSALGLFAALSPVLSRPNLHRDTSLHYSRLVGAAVAEVHAVALLFLTQWQDPPPFPHFPYHAGRAAWAQALQRRMDDAVVPVSRRSSHLCRRV